MGIGQLQPEEGSWGRDSLLCPFSAPGSLGSSRGELSSYVLVGFLFVVVEAGAARPQEYERKEKTSGGDSGGGQQDAGCFLVMQGRRPTNRWNKQTLVAVSHPAG